MNLELIKTEIEKKGLKQVWLADQISVHPKTLSRFLNGKTEMGLLEVAKLLGILNIKFEALMKKAS